MSDPNGRTIAFNLHYSTDPSGYFAEIFDAESGDHIRKTRVFKSKWELRRHAQSLVRKLEAGVIT